MKKILLEGKKTRQKRAEAEASKEDEAIVLAAGQARASASESINDKADMKEIEQCCYGWL